MAHSLQDLQEYHAASKELLSAIRDIGSPSTSTSTTSSTSFVPCPNNPGHARIPVGSLERHLNKCPSLAPGLNDQPFRTLIQGSSSIYLHKGARPSSRLKGPPPASENFYKHSQGILTILYKDAAKELNKTLIKDEDRDPTLAHAGLFRVDQPGSNAVFLYDPASDSTLKEHPEFDPQTPRNEQQGYLHHQYLVNLIKSSTPISKASQSNQPPKDKHLQDTRPMIPADIIAERVNTLRKRKARERQQDLLLEAERLERELKRRRQAYRAGSARVKLQKARDQLQGSDANDTETIRKQLATGKAGAWKAAIEVFAKDQLLILEAEMELQEEQARETGQSVRKSRDSNQEGSRVDRSREGHRPKTSKPHETDCAEKSRHSYHESYRGRYTSSSRDRRDRSRGR